MERPAVTPSIGWGVLHLYYRVDRVAPAEHRAAVGAAVTAAVTALEADGHQVLAQADRKSTRLNSSHRT